MSQRIKTILSLLNSNLKPMKITEDTNKSLEVSLAPMLEVTTANFRKFVRITSKHTVLFTEMIVSSTVTHINREKLLERLGEIDDLTVVQIGGSDPCEISNAIGILKSVGCTNFNLNLGCPSSRVQKGCFGAVLMKDKHLVGNIVNQVYNDHKIILSLKIRTGVDDLDSYDFFKSFVVYIVENTPVNKFYVHARKCWLNGLSPKQNRNLPFLNYDFVYKIKNELPHTSFILNGGIKNLKNVENLDGVMIGREAIKNILVFKDIEELMFGVTGDCLLDFVKKYLMSFDQTQPISVRILNPLQHVLHGKNGTKKWKKFCNEAVHIRKLTIENFIIEIEKLNIL